MKAKLTALSCMLAAAGLASPLAMAQEKVKIGFVTDMSSLYADVEGKNAVTAMQMAIDDFGGKVLGQPIELLSADHQNKADIAANQARQWGDSEQAPGEWQSYMGCSGSGCLDWGLHPAQIAQGSRDLRRSAAQRKRTLHLTPVRMLPAGLGSSSRTPKVPLAESTTLSTICTDARCRPFEGASASISGWVPVRIWLYSATGSTTSTRSGWIWAILRMGRAPSPAVLCTSDYTSTRRGSLRTTLPRRTCTVSIRASAELRFSILW
jgi:hypothetical protein